MNDLRKKELLDIVRINYEAIANDFDVTRKKVLWPTLADLAAHVRDGDAVLDVGCGNGRLLQVFAGRNIRFVGTDLSANLIALAQKNSSEFSKGIDSEFLVSNILNLDKDVEGQFDWIFSHAVIHHLPGTDLQVKALKNMKSKLKPGGRIVFSVWRPWGSKKLVRELFRTIGHKLIGRHPYAWNDLVFVWKNNQSPRYYHFFTNWELRRLVRKAGLELIEMRVEKRNYYLVLK